MNLTEIKNRILPAERRERTEKPKPKPILIAVLVGAILFLIISSVGGCEEGKQNEAPEKEREISTEAYLSDLENRLQKTLEKMEGVGKVSVFLCAVDHGEKILAQDRKNESAKEVTTEKSEKNNGKTEETVAMHGQGTGQSPYVVREKLPEISGVLIIAEGAEDETVRREIYEAAKALFSLPAHRIKVSY